MGEQSLTYFAYVCFMLRNDGMFLPYLYIWEFRGSPPGLVTKELAGDDGFPVCAQDHTLFSLVISSVTKPDTVGEPYLRSYLMLT